MTAKELIDAIEAHVGEEEFTDAINGDSDALDIDIRVDLTAFGMGKRHIADALFGHDDGGNLMLLIGQRANA